MAVEVTCLLGQSHREGVSKSLGALLLWEQGDDGLDVMLCNFEGKEKTKQKSTENINKKKCKVLLSTAAVTS